ncbi:MAG: hypothetical protein IK064_03145, partial [Clostridia bacterium]|nr:hypothetical protein [Clostridia bacterium]
DLVPDLTVDRMRELVTESFIREYGPAGEYCFTPEEEADIARRAERQRSWEWRFGKTPPFDYTLEHRFPFGEMQFRFGLKDGEIRSLTVYSDCLDTSLTSDIEAALIGKRFTDEAIGDALGGQAAANLGEKKAELEELRDFFMSGALKNDR